METQRINRRQQASRDLGLTSQRETQRIDKALAKEENRRMAKEMRQMELESSTSYGMVKGISTVMDKYCLDPIIGLFPVAGDMLSSIFTLPFIYMSLFKIRSIPLTLAIISNMLIDVLIGMIPFWVGNIFDFLNRSYLKNFKLITGFVEDDRETIEEVNKKAIWMLVIIGIVCFLIYLLIGLVANVVSWVGGLFA
ncbi:DUF4112 domain-containing protein [Bacteroides sp. OttesenSCG-928-D19]|nr:DUF4112 domain-containing protein [Bacteroides sp. OttesenSCG-928-D19]